MTPEEKAELDSLRAEKMSSAQTAELAQLRSEKAAATQRDETQSATDVQNDVKKKFNVSPLETGVSDFSNLFGFGDEAYGAAKAVGDLPSTISKYGLSKEAARSLLKKYRTERDTARQAFAASDEKNPKSAIAGNVAQAFVPVGGLAAAKGASGWQKAQTAARFGAVYGLGHSDADLTSGDADEAAQAVKDTSIGAVTNAGMSKIPARALVGGGLGYLAARGNLDRGEYGTATAKIGAGALTGQFLPKIMTGGKRVYGNVLGVGPESIDDYLARSKEINASPSKTSVVQSVDAVVGGLRDRLDDAKDQVKALSMDTRQDVRSAVAKAEQALQAAKDSKSLDAAQAVEEALADLKGKVIEGSKSAREAIPTAKQNSKAFAEGATPPEGFPAVGGIETKGLSRQLSKQIKRLQPMGDEAGAPPGAATASVGRLQQWNDWIKKLPDNLTYEQAKPIIQRLDQATQETYNAPAGTFAPEEQLALKRMRQFIDMKLKAGVPEYEQRMVPVAEDTRLLNTARKELPPGRGMISRLQNLDNPANAGSSESLDALGRRTGRDFGTMLDTTPEQNALDEIRNRATPKSIAQTIGASPEAQGLSEASRDYAKVKGATNSEAFLNRMMAGKEVPVDPKLKDQDLMEALSNHIPELPQQVKNLKTLSAFQGDRTNGSRNTVLGGMVGAGLSALGGHLSPVSMGEAVALGGATGHMVDKYGPRVAKKGLDAYIGGRETTQAVISRLAQRPETQAAARVLSKAAEKGDQAFAARYYLMTQQYPEIQKALENEDDNK